ncbi:PX-domain-containing protein [Backusella circina FSU 941]|nr:PX-domain-containing protein [Backusella circina FSU 941]
MHSTQCHCSIQKTLNETSNAIKIVSSEKKQIEQNKSSSYIVYIITVKATKRRYSEFESFRKSLVRLYPTSLIPPIPEKQSITEYAQKQKDDTHLIEKRKRMLERFLTRISEHPILKREHVFHRFMDGSTTWSDILNSPPLSTLPKDALLSNDFTSSITQNLSSATTAATSIIPIPSSSYVLKYPDSTFDESEVKVGKVPQQASSSFEKSQKRILKRLGDLSNDYSELGSAYNALSLNETGPLSNSIEKMGKVIDDSCTQTKEMVNSLEVEFSEYVQEYTQYISIAQQILRYRHMKQSQLELVEEAIDTKKSLLRSLMRTEDEATKLKAEITQPISDENRKPFAIQVNNDEDFDTQSLDDGYSAIVKSELQQDEEDYEESKKQSEQVIYPPGASAESVRSSRNQSRKWSSPRKLFSAMSVTLQGMIDTDPEQTRRLQITKIKQVIEQLEQAKTSIRQELSDMSESIQEDFERLEKQKQAEFRKILISFARIHLFYCEQNTVSWKEFRSGVSVELNKLK